LCVIAQPLTSITNRGQSGHVLATRRHLSCSESSITACHDCVGMSDGKRLNSSFDILKRHYPQVASLRDYIDSILINATEIALVVPEDPEVYRDLLENSKVGCHQPPYRKYRAGASVFEIDEVRASNSQFPLSTYARLGHQKVAVVPPPCSRRCEKCYYSWLQGTLDATFWISFPHLPHRLLTREPLSILRNME